MCGIAGVLSAAASFDPVAARALGHRMASVLHHRGPDGGGVLVDPAHGAVLAHRRLAVVELSDAGAQPMLSRSGRTAIVFNGEIYNFRELRTRLAGWIGIDRWRGQSDCEVLVEAVEALGLDAALSEMAGMFAFALLDRRDGRLTLARDRFGEKPLYFRAEAQRVLFGSDADPIVAVAGRPGIETGALHDVLRYGFVRLPRSIYSGIEQVPPGCHLSFTRDGGVVRGEGVRRYWTAARASTDADAVADAAPAGATVRARLETVIGEQMLADVPVGAFLSGGIDSSLVVALMQAQSARKVRTFTISLRDKDHDESAHAEAVAHRLGTDHTTFMLDEADALGMIGEVVQAYAEPFADASQIPTCCVARLARREVTTVLTGDGGDELFGGYNRHVFAARHWRRIALLPPALRRGAGRLLATAAHPALAGTWNRLGDVLPRQARIRRASEKLAKTGEVLPAASIADFQDRLLRLAPGAGRFLRPDLRHSSAAGADPAIPAWDLDASALTPAEQVMLRDAEVYLPGDVLTKVDRAAMSVALETRAPFLDHRVAAAAWRLPLDAKIRSGQGKHVLRELLAEHLPRAMFERPKTGFGIPLGRWLRTGFESLAAQHFEARRLEASGLFDVAAVTDTWRAHRRGTVDAASELWPVLMVQAWLAREPRGGPPITPRERREFEATSRGDPSATCELFS